jgi:hypothetical protein
VALAVLSAVQPLQVVAILYLRLLHQLEEAEVEETEVPLKLVGPAAAALVAVKQALQELQIKDMQAGQEFLCRVRIQPVVEVAPGPQALQGLAVRLEMAEMV